MTTYEILHKKYCLQGPFTLAQIKQLVEAGDIAKEQEVRKSDTNESISADYALIFFEDDTLKEERDGSGGSKVKMVFGAVMSVAGLVVAVLLIQAIRAEQEVSRRLIVVSVVLVLAGAKVFQKNLAAKECEVLLRWLERGEWKWVTPELR